MKFYLPLCLLFFIRAGCEAQHGEKRQNKIDSLKQGLAATSGKDRLAFLSELNMVYRDSLHEIAFAYANQYYKLAMTLGDSVNMVNGGRMISYSLMDLGKNEEAVHLLVKMIGIAERNSDKSPHLKSQIKLILNNAGLAYTYMGKYDSALEFHYRSLSIREQEGDKKSIRAALNNIGFVFYNLSDYEHAIQNYMKAVAISSELNEFKGQEIYLINIGLSFNALGKPLDAIRFTQDALKICEGNCDANTQKGAYYGLGLAYYHQGKFTEAKMYFNKSLDKARKQNDYRFICDNLISLGEIENDLHHENACYSYFKEGLIFAEASRLAERRLDLYRKLSIFFKGKNDFKNAFSFMVKYSQLKDSIYNRTVMKNLTKSQIDYSEREKVKTIKAKDQVLLLKEELIQKQRLQTVLIALVASLLFLLVVLLYKFYRDKLLINIKLDRKVKERTEELRKNNSNLVHANELQQSLLQKIGRDGQSIISGIKGLCNTAAVDLADEKVKAYLRKVDENTDKLLSLLSRTSH